MKPSEKCARALCEMPFRGRPTKYSEMAEVIAEHTNCDDGYVEPELELEIEWRFAFPTQWVVYVWSGSVPKRACVRAANGVQLSGDFDLHSERGAAYAHMVKCVNKCETESTP